MKKHTCSRPLIPSRRPHHKNPSTKRRKYDDEDKLETVMESRQQVLMANVRVKLEPQPERKVMRSKDLCYMSMEWSLRHGEIIITNLNQLFFDP